jgi:hypothetical protein|tara:strand:+ start:89 stop:244 length:156 start_codon:yes stop_codon:yes gene_type:complete
MLNGWLSLVVGQEVKAMAAAAAAAGDSAPATEPVERDQAPKLTSAPLFRER